MSFSIPEGKHFNDPLFSLGIPVNFAPFPSQPVATKVENPKKSNIIPEMELLQALQKEQNLDGEFAYCNPNSQEVQKETIPESMVPGYEQLLLSRLKIPISYGGYTYKLQVTVVEQLEWVSAYAAAIGSPIRWVLRGGALAHQLGPSFFKDRLERQHPDHYEKIAELGCTSLLTPPPDVDLSAKCIYNNEAFDVGNSHTLNLVYGHFRSIEFEVRYLNGPREKLLGFEAFFQHILNSINLESLIFVTITNHTIPWMYHREWLNDNLKNLIQEIQKGRETFETLQKNPSPVELCKFFEQYAQLIFKKTFTEFKEGIESGIHYRIPPHNKLKNTSQFFYRRFVFFDESGKEFDFTHFNSTTQAEEQIYKASQNIYLELPNSPLQSDHTLLCWSEQAILDRACGVFRLTDRVNIKEMWLYYASALTQGEICPQKELHALLQEAFVAYWKTERVEAVKLLNTVTEKIKSRYMDSRGPLLAFFFHVSSASFAKEDLEALLKLSEHSYYVHPTALSPYDLSHGAPTHHLGLLDQRTYPSRRTLEAILHLLALRFLLMGSIETKQHSFFKARLINQGGITFIAFQLHGTFFQVPFDPVNALREFIAYARLPEHLPQLLNLAHAFPLPDLFDTVGNFSEFPPFDHDAWFKQLIELNSLSHPLFLDLSLILLHHSIAFVPGKTVFTESLKLSSRILNREPPLRFMIIDWLVHMTSQFSPLSEPLQNRFTVALQEAKMAPPSVDLYSFYLELCRQNALIAPVPSYLHKVLAAPLEVSPPKQMVAPPTKPATGSHPKEIKERPAPKPAAKSPPKGIKQTAPAKPAAKSPPKEIKESTPAKPAAKSPPKETIQTTQTSPVEIKATSREPILTAEEQLKHLLKEFEKGDPRPNWKRMLECCEKAQTIPRLDPVLNHLKKGARAPEAIEFLGGLFRIQCERQQFKKAKELYKGFLKDHIPTELDETARRFWIDRVQDFMAAPEEAAMVYEIFEMLERHCRTGREAVSAALNKLPCVLIEFSLHRCGALISKLKPAMEVGLPEFCSKNLEERSSASLERILELLEAAHWEDLRTWSILFSLMAPSDLTLVKRAYEVGKTVLATIDSKLDPANWTALQSFHHRLFFRIYREEPTLDNYRHLRTLWDNLSGPEDFVEQRCRAFVFQFLQETRQHLLDEMVLSHLEGWFASLNADDFELAYAYGSVIIRQTLTTQKGPEAIAHFKEMQYNALKLFVNALKVQPEVLVEDLAQAIRCFAFTVQSTELADASVLLIEFCNFSLELLKKASDGEGLLAFVLPLDFYRKQIPTSETTLRDNLIKIGYDFACLGLEYHRKGVRPEYLHGLFELLRALDGNDRFINQACQLLYKIAKVCDISNDPVYKSITVKGILHAFTSESMAILADGIAECFAEVEKHTQKAERSTFTQNRLQQLLFYFDHYFDNKIDHRSFEERVFDICVLIHLQHLSDSKADISEKMFQTLKNRLEVYYNRLGKGKSGSHVNFSLLRNRDFLKQLLDLQIASPNSSWLMLSLAGDLIKRLFREVEHRDSVCALLGKFCLHPSFQNYTTERAVQLFGIAFLGDIKREKFIPKIGLTGFNQLSFYLTGEFCNWPGIPSLEENFKKLLCKNIIDSLFKIGTCSSIQKALHILEECPFENTLQEQKGRVESALKAVHQTPFQRKEKRVLLLEIIRFMSAKPQLLGMVELYTSLFDVGMAFLDTFDEDAVPIFEALTCCQFKELPGSAAIATRLMAEPTMHVQQNFRIALLQPIYVETKLNMITPPYTQEHGQALQLLMDMMLLLDPFTARGKIPASLIEGVKKLEQILKPRRIGQGFEKILLDFIHCFEPNAELNLDGIKGINKSS